MVITTCTATTTSAPGLWICILILDPHPVSDVCFAHFELCQHPECQHVWCSRPSSRSYPHQSVSDPLVVLKATLGFTFFWLRFCVLSLRFLSPTSLQFLFLFALLQVLVKSPETVTHLLSLCGQTANKDEEFSILPITQPASTVCWKTHGIPVLPRQLFLSAIPMEKKHNPGLKVIKEIIYSETKFEWPWFGSMDISHPQIPCSTVEAVSWEKTKKVTSQGKFEVHLMGTSERQVHKYRELSPRGLRWGIWRHS